MFFQSITLDIYHLCKAADRRRDLAMRSRIDNPTINPNTGERIRPLTQQERWRGLPDNSWVVSYD